jgi:hypothetical protein
LTFVTTFPPLAEIDVAGPLVVVLDELLVFEDGFVGSSSSSSRIDEDDTLVAGGADGDEPLSLDAEPAELAPELGLSEPLLDVPDDEDDELLPEEPSSAAATPAPESIAVPTPKVIAPAPSQV